MPPLDEASVSSRSNNEARHARHARRNPLAESYPIGQGVPFPRGTLLRTGVLLALHVLAEKGPENLSDRLPPFRSSCFRRLPQVVVHPERVVRRLGLVRHAANPMAWHTPFVVPTPVQRSVVRSVTGWHTTNSSKVSSTSHKPCCTTHTSRAREAGGKGLAGNAARHMFHAIDRILIQVSV